MKRFLSMVCLVCCVVCANAQTITDVFTAMPDSLQPLLTKTNRLDLIDFKKSKMKAEVTNNLNGKTELKELTDHYLSLVLTPVSLCEMKMLPIEDTYILCVVKTIKAVAQESEVAFYSLDWKKLDTAIYLKYPMLSAFWKKPNKKLENAYHRAQKIYSVPYLEVHLKANTADLTMHLNLDELLIEERKEVSDFLHKDFVLSWQNGKFQAQGALSN
ncbi:MAG: DUF3256 family protein [Bacteroidaceae bacterium]